MTKKKMAKKTTAKSPARGKKLANLPMPGAVRVALLSMGYRLLPKCYDVYGKPVGYHLLVANMRGKKLVITNRFQGAKDMLIYNSARLSVSESTTSEEAAEFIQTTECHTDLHFSTRWLVNYFVSTEEQITALLDG